jgi:hypothetical protein
MVTRSAAVTVMADCTWVAGQLRAFDRQLLRIMHTCAWGTCQYTLCRCNKGMLWTVQAAQSCTLPATLVTLQQWQRQSCRQFLLTYGFFCCNMDCGQPRCCAAHLLRKGLNMPSMKASVSSTLSTNRMMCACFTLSNWASTVSVVSCALAFMPSCRS